MTVLGNDTRKLLPKSDESSSGSSNSSNYTGCLSMSYDELQSSWQFPGEMPSCTGGASETDNNYYSTSSLLSSFDISACETYSNVWLWDLALTCEDLSTLEGCECTFAEEYESLGEVSCATSSSSEYACPAGCNVCQTCMMLLGCDDIYTQPMSGVANYLPYLVASAIGLGATAAILYASNYKNNNKRRRQRVLANKGANRNLNINSRSHVNVNDNGVNAHIATSHYDNDHVGSWRAPMII